MPTNITDKEAREIRAKAIAKAKNLKVADLVCYMLASDVAIKEGITSTRALPGSGYIMRGVFWGENDYDISVTNVDNPSEYVFRYTKGDANERIVVFRDGPWVLTLIKAAEALKYELENSDAIKILNNFAPMKKNDLL